MTPIPRLTDLDRLSRGRIRTEEDALALIRAGVRDYLEASKARKPRVYGDETHEAECDVAAAEFGEELNETR